MFENRLKQLRILKGLNMKQTATLLNLPYTTYVSYEKNEREPNSEILVLLADFFECSVDYLVGRSTQVKTNSNDFTISDHEKQLVIAYRKQPAMQSAVDKLLGVEELIPSLVAARSINNDEPITIQMLPDLSKIKPDDTDL